MPLRPKIICTAFYNLITSLSKCGFDTIAVLGAIFFPSLHRYNEYVLIRNTVARLVDKLNIGIEAALFRAFVRDVRLLNLSVARLF